MPGKKKGKGKGKKGSGKKKGKTPSAKKSTAQAGPEVIDEATREFYLLQLRDLEERVKRYREKTDALEMRNKDLEARLQQEQRDKFDITITLKRQLGETSDLNAELHEKLAELHGLRQADKDSFDQQLQAMKTQLKEQREQLNAEVKKLRKELKMLEDFRQMKEDLEARTKRLETLLGSKEEDVKKYKMDTEKKMILDQDRLKREMSEKLIATANQFRQVSEQRMTDTTKRAMSENSYVHNVLGEVCSDAASLSEKNNKLKGRVEKLSMDLELAQASLDEEIKRKVGNEKVIRMLVIRMQEQATKLEEAEQRAEQAEHLKMQLGVSERQRQSLLTSTSDSSKNIDKLEKTLQETEQDLDGLRSSHGMVTEVLSDLSALLHERLGGSLPEGYDATRSEGDIMTRMFEVMRLAGEQDVIKPKRAAVAGLTDTSFTKPPSTRDAARPSDSFDWRMEGHRHANTLPPLPARSDSMAGHYAPGLVGMVASELPAQELDARLVRRQPHRHGRMASSGSVGVQCRSIGVQTASIPRALLLADRIMESGGDLETNGSGQRKTSTLRTASRTALTESQFYLQSQLSQQEQVLVDSIKQSATKRLGLPQEAATESAEATAS